MRCPCPPCEADKYRNDRSEELGGGPPLSFRQLRLVAFLSVFCWIQPFDAEPGVAVDDVEQRDDKREQDPRYELRRCESEHASCEDRRDSPRNEIDPDGSCSLNCSGQVQRRKAHSPVRVNEASGWQNNSEELRAAGEADEECRKNRGRNERPSSFDTTNKRADQRGEDARPVEDPTKRCCHDDQSYSLEHRGDPTVAQQAIDCLMP